MKIEIHPINRVRLDDFADKHDLVMEVRERDLPRGNPSRYYASFKGAEIKEGNFLTGTYGDGSTPGKAAIDYARRISGKLLVVGAYTENRREIRVPILI